MEQLHLQFNVNEPDVVFEVFDEEVVIVNLETGTYYSLRGGAPAIWLALTKGADGAAIEQAYAARANGADGADAASIAAFIAELVAERLLRPAPDAVSGAEFVLEEGAGLPELERFSEMEDLLMLDPVHEVDPKGWPVAKEA